MAAMCPMSLSAFPRTEPIDVLHGPAFGEVNRLISIAADTAQRIAQANPAPHSLAGMSAGPAAVKAMASLPASRSSRKSVSNR